MFSTFRQKLLLGIYIFILLSVPVGAYLASQQQTAKSSASEKKSTVKPTSKSTLSPAQSLLKNAEGQLLSSSPSPVSQPSPDSSTTTTATSFGPTLSLKVTLEGRPANSFATKLFVGIVAGTLTANPKFLLSFSLDLPSSGQYSGLSLAGLNPGSAYTALLKGSSQIATSSAFTMSPTMTNLNNGQPLNLLSGDLNDDNVVNSADYSIAQKAFGASTASANWNANADLNQDGIINSFDLAIVAKNIGQAGASGAWTSPVPKVATPSAGLSSPVGPDSIGVGGPAPRSPQGEAGYWLWLPK